MKQTQIILTFFRTTIYRTSYAELVFIQTVISTSYNVAHKHDNIGEICRQNEVHVNSHCKACWETGDVN